LGVFATLLGLASTFFSSHRRLKPPPVLRLRRSDVSRPWHSRLSEPNKICGVACENSVKPAKNHRFLLSNPIGHQSA